IEGPVGAVATIDRGNISAGSYAFYFAGADDVTITGLSITDGYYGVVLGANQDSDRVTISNNDIYGMYLSCVSIRSGDDSATITGNTVRDDLDFNSGADGIEVSNATGTVIAGNKALNLVIGISVGVGNGQVYSVANNYASGNSYVGINVSGYGATGTVSNNTT